MEEKSSGRKIRTLESKERKVPEPLGRERKEIRERDGIKKVCKRADSRLRLLAVSRGRDCSFVNGKVR